MLEQATPRDSAYLLLFSIRGPSINGALIKPPEVNPELEEVVLVSLPLLAAADVTHPVKPVENSAS